MDKEARFKEVFEANKDRIYRLCCCYVQGGEERKDAYQEVLTHIWESLDKFEGRSQISTWIYRIAVNTCIEYLRSENRRKRFIEKNSDAQTTEVADQRRNSEPDSAPEDIDRLYRCINALPAVDKTLISLFLEDVSTREMAEILGISEISARVRLHRIKKTLKQKIEGCNNGSARN